MNALLLLLVTLMSASARQFHYKLNGKNSWFSEYFYIYRDSSNYDSYSTHSGTYAYFNSPGNVQYEILLSTGSYGWVDGAWVRIYGEYDQLYFQSGPFDGKKPLSLYLPIDKGEYWSYSDSISSSSWITDTTSNWNSYTGGNSFSAGTRRYLKKTFSGANNIAAFEMGVSYRYGIVVYVNGHEVYRDNVEEGPIYAFTSYTQSYSSQDFHSFIRSAYHISADGDNTVAVMLLLRSGYQTSFDAWMSLYSPSPYYTTNSAMCYHYSVDSHPCSDLTGSTSCTVGSNEMIWTSNKGEMNGIGFDQRQYASSSQSYIVKWGYPSQSENPQRQYTIDPSTSSKGWYNYGLPPIRDSKISFSVSGGSMTFDEIHLLTCRRDNSELRYPSSIISCYKSNPCTIRPLSTILPGFVSVSDLPSGLSMSYTGVISGTPLSTGTFTSTITTSGHTFFLKVRVNNPSRITSFSYPGSHQFRENQEIGLKPEVSGAPFTVSIVSGSLPSGVTLNTETGVISGFASTGQVTLTLKASNSLGSSQTTLTLRVGNPQTENFYPSSYKAQQNSYFSISPTSECSGCIYTVETSLPSGVSLDHSTGVISGSCSTAIDAWTIKVRRNSEYGTSTTTFVLTIRARSTQLTPITSFSYDKSKYTLVKGRSFSTKPRFNGNEVFFQVVSGKLPKGLGLTSSGEIKGAPLETTSSTRVEIQARNGVSRLSVVLYFTVSPFSTGEVVLIVVLILLVIAAFIMVLFMYKKKKKLDIQNEATVKKSLPKPVPANTTVVINTSNPAVMNPGNQNLSGGGGVGGMQQGVGVQQGVGGMQQGNLVGMQQNPVGYAQAFYPVGSGQAFYPYGTMQPMTCNPMNQSMPSNNGKPM